MKRIKGKFIIRELSCILCGSTKDSGGDDYLTNALKKSTGYFGLDYPLVLTISEKDKVNQLPDGLYEVCVNRKKCRSRQKEGTQK